MGITHYVVPHSLIGRGIPEDTIKRGLRDLNPEFHFDLGGRHNKWHPDIDYSQGVYWRELHICTMDRGTIPEVPIWTTKREAVTIPWGELRFNETHLLDPHTGCPIVMRMVNDKVIQVGWRNTLTMIVHRKIPGADKAAIEVKFGIDLGTKPIEEVSVVEAALDRTTNKEVFIR